VIGTVGKNMGKKGVVPTRTSPLPSRACGGEKDPPPSEKSTLHPKGLNRQFKEMAFAEKSPSHIPHREKRQQTEEGNFASEREKHFSAKGELTIQRKG